MKQVMTSVVVLIAASGLAGAQTTDLSVWYADAGKTFQAGVGMPVGGQVVGQIAQGQPIRLNSEYQFGINNVGGTSPAVGLTVSVPDSFGYNGWSDSLVDYSHSSGRVLIRRVDPLGQSDGGYYPGIDSRTATQFTNAPVGLTRTWDTPQLTSDSVTGHLSVDLQVTAGQLAGANSLDVNLYQPSDLPAGIEASFVPGSVVVPAGFTYTGYEYAHLSGTDPALLNGTYHFEGDLQITRTGDYAQANYGDLIFVPSTEVTYANQQTLTPSVGQSLNLPGTNAVISVNGPQATTWSGSVNHDRVSLGIGAFIAHDAAPQVNSVTLVKLKGKGLDGTVKHIFMCDISGDNIAAATIQTPTGPNQQTYELAFDSGDGTDYLDINADDEAGLTSRGFINGQYVLTVYDRAGTPTAYTFDLSGTYPSALPVFTTNTIADPDNATVGWQAAPSGTTGLHVSLEAGDPSDYEVFLSPTDTEYNFGAVPPVGHESVVSFFDGQLANVGGIDQIIGYVTETAAILDVASPGDFNLDGQVEQTDLTLLLSNWGSSAVSPEWTGDFDGLVDQSELNDLLANWGSGIVPADPLAGTPTPEPATLVVLLLGGCQLARRKTLRRMG